MAGNRNRNRRGRGRGGRNNNSNNGRKQPCKNMPNCRYGNNCKFSHDVGNQGSMMVDNNNFSYNNNNNNNNSNNNNNGRKQPCKNFPNCRYGNNCKFSHDVGNQGNMMFDSNPGWGVAPSNPNNGWHNNNNWNQSNNNNANNRNNRNGNNNQNKKPCRFFFQNGKCRYGNSCKFSHDSNDGNMEISSSQDPFAPTPAQQAGNGFMNFMALANNNNNNNNNGGPGFMSNLGNDPSMIMAPGASNNNPFMSNMAANPFATPPPAASNPFQPDSNPFQVNSNPFQANPSGLGNIGLSSMSAAPMASMTMAPAGAMPSFDAHNTTNLQGLAFLTESKNRSCLRHKTMEGCARGILKEMSLIRWPLTCYGHSYPDYKQANVPTCIPADVSPEELRWEMYRTNDQNHYNQYYERAVHRLKEMQQAMLKSPAMILNGAPVEQNRPQSLTSPPPSTTAPKLQAPSSLSSPQAATPSKPSADEHQQAMQQFQAGDFEYGMIPEIPPPASLA